MSSTMTPFLYHTRTIARLQRFTDTTYTAQTSASNAAQDNGAFKGVRKVMTPIRSLYSDNVGPTFEEQRTAWRSLQTNGIDGKIENDDDRPSTIDFEESDEGLVDYGSEIDALTNRSYPRMESTITDSERHAFHKIFSDILARSQTGPIHDKIENKTPVDLANAKSRLDSILGDAISSQPQTLWEKKAAVNKYPPALRRAAARAVGLYPQEDDATSKPDVNLDMLEKEREIERDRVEGLLRGAKTDFHLWEILEKEVFPLIGKMGLQENAPPEPKAKKPIGNKSKTAKYHAAKARGYKNILPEEPLPPFQKQPQEIPQLSLYGPLYPSYLLLGLRLLDRSFSRTSPLALSILPRIKSLGLISHVLGASTALYNELIQIYWFRYEDVSSCLDLLQEMQDAGLDYNKDTLNVVQEIIRLRYIMRKGDMGESLRVRYLMPDYKKSAKFLAWKETIEQTVLFR
ncbi:hypothetical protein ACMFMG_008510 [Clarireedia jacksonii]